MMHTPRPKIIGEKECLAEGKFSREELAAIDRARLFATAAHAAVGQVRKYTGESYIVHPAEAVEIVKENYYRGISAKGVQVLWLHDVVEDTKITLDDIRRAFGPIVEQIVEALTDVPMPGVNRKNRKLETIRRLTDQKYELYFHDIHTAKIAGLISNFRSISVHDVKFAKTFAAEALDLIIELNNADERLRLKLLRDIYVFQKKQSLKPLP